MMEDYERAAQIDDMKEELKTILATIPLMANVLWVSYQALQQEGFSDEQALELTKSRGIGLV
jgi:hypothetical protein